jgi:hypothetical protein
VDHDRSAGGLCLHRRCSSQFIGEPAHHPLAEAPAGTDLWSVVTGNSRPSAISFHLRRRRAGIEKKIEAAWRSVLRPLATARSQDTVYPAAGVATELGRISSRRHPGRRPSEAGGTARRYCKRRFHDVSIPARPRSIRLTDVSRTPGFALLQRVQR